MMQQEHDHSSHTGPSGRNGDRGHSSDTVPFAVHPAGASNVDGRQPGGRPADDPARTASDALMRCYNG